MKSPSTSGTCLATTESFVPSALVMLGSFLKHHPRFDSCRKISSTTATCSSALEPDQKSRICKAFHVGITSGPAGTDRRPDAPRSKACGHGAPAMEGRRVRRGSVSAPAPPRRRRRATVRTGQGWPCPSSSRSPAAGRSPRRGSSATGAIARAGEARTRQARQPLEARAATQLELVAKDPACRQPRHPSERLVHVGRQADVRRRADWPISAVVRYLQGWILILQPVSMWAIEGLPIATMLKTN